MPGNHHIPPYVGIFSDSHGLANTEMTANNIYLQRQKPQACADNGDVYDLGFGILGAWLLVSKDH